jgi:hypothetical protein
MSPDRIETSYARAAKRVLLNALFVSAVCVHGACQQRPEGPTDPAPPRPREPSVPLQWWTDGELRNGVSSATFALTSEAGEGPLKLQATFRAWPKGTSFLVGSSQGLASEGDWQTSIDIRFLLREKPLEALQEPVDLGVGIAVAPPGHAPAATMLPKYDVRPSLRMALAGIRGGGVRFGDGDSEPGRPRGAAILSGTRELNFVGTARTLMEVDWVIVAEDAKEPSGQKTCLYQQGVGLLRFYDANVVTYERRTGKTIASEVIQKRPECPPSAWADIKERWAKSSVLTEEIAAWTTRQLREARK